MIQLFVSGLVQCHGPQASLQKWIAVDLPIGGDQHGQGLDFQMFVALC